MLALPVTWWKPLNRMEKGWVLVAFTWCLILTVMMPLWFFIGRQNVPVTTYRVTPVEYFETVNAFVDEYRVDTLNGVPVIGADRSVAGDPLAVAGTESGTRGRLHKPSRLCLVSH